MFYNLKAEYEPKYGLRLLPDAEDYLKTIDSDVRLQTVALVSSGETKAHDLLQSLVYSKSCDIALSRRAIFSPDAPQNDITTSDIQFSILTMPCDCPINYSCCENIVNGDINYVVAFPQDAEMLKKQGIVTIQNMSERLDRRDTLLTMVDSIQSIKSPLHEKLADLYGKKVEIWRRSSQDIAMPLAHIYRENNFPSSERH